MLSAKISTELFFEIIFKSESKPAFRPCATS